MKLTKFKLVNTEGRTGVFYKGRTIPFEKIDDKLAEELLGKTDILERLPMAASAKELTAPPATTEPAALPEASDPVVAEATAPTSRRRTNG